MNDRDSGSDLARQIAGYTFRTLRWGRDHVPPGIRSLIGVLFMVGGVFGFLPVLGFWMFPLGIAFVALDVPWTRHHIHSWMDDLREVAYRVPSSAPAPSRPEEPKTKP